MLSSLGYGLTLEQRHHCETTLLLMSQKIGVLIEPGRDHVASCQNTPLLQINCLLLDQKLQSEER